MKRPGWSLRVSSCRRRSIATAAFILARLTVRGHIHAAALDLLIQLALRACAWVGVWGQRRHITHHLLLVVADRSGIA